MMTINKDITGKVSISAHGLCRNRKPGKALGVFLFLNEQDHIQIIRPVGSSSPD
jgi:hypothetical protein